MGLRARALFAKLASHGLRGPCYQAPDEATPQVVGKHRWMAPRELGRRSNHHWHKARWHASNAPGFTPGDRYLHARAKVNYHWHKARWHESNAPGFTPGDTYLHARAKVRGARSKVVGKDEAQKPMLRNKLRPGPIRTPRQISWAIPTCSARIIKGTQLRPLFAMLRYWVRAVRRTFKSVNGEFDGLGSPSYH